ncbi:MAG: SpoIID/LytB domain-containing protein [Flavobacteriales bacterium]|jgi:stage II sporulation protein D|nr:MAG: SpoIID/LytB domain-containing protein [Flavobacteriales bacterium]
MRLTTLLFALLLPLCMLAQETVLRIGILRERTFRSVLVMSAKGTCTVFADGERKGEIQVNDGLRIDLAGRHLTARSLNLSVTAKESIELVPRMDNSGLRLRLPESKMAERTYPGSLRIISEGGRLVLVNSVPLDAYTAGVVQAEAGREHRQEYYKLQSVSCRTYALSNVRKHAPEGFELCDAVHCQVYHGACKVDSIKMAVEATHNMVLVDADIKLIHALFHSNCGGETMNAEDLWAKREPYLRATVDTYCRSERNATWQRTLTKKEWVGYLERRFGVKTSDKSALAAVLNYEPLCRDLYLGNTTPLIPLKHVREDLKLKSTFFSVTTTGEQVVLNGRGFGHGVGLCQEGAMHMARDGKSYIEILRHYYTDVHLVDVNTLDFFRDAEKPKDTAGPKR